LGAAALGVRAALSGCICSRKGCSSAGLLGGGGGSRWGLELQPAASVCMR
jgi:hypothetical protein